MGVVKFPRVHVPERMDLDLESQLAALKKEYEDGKSTFPCVK